MYISCINLEVLESRCGLGNAFVGNTLTGKDASLTANLYVQRTVVFYSNISNFILTWKCFHVQKSFTLLTFTFQDERTSRQYDSYLITRPLWVLLENYLKSYKIIKLNQTLSGGLS